MPGARELGHHQRHRRPPNAQHDGEELVRERELILLDAIVRHQEPAAASLLRRMQPVARDRLHQQIDERLRVPGDAIVKGAVPFHLAAERVDAHHGGRLGGDLHERLPRRYWSPEHRSDADQTFTANRCHFDDSAVLHHIGNRADAASRKENFRNRLAMFMEHLAYF